MNKHEQYLHDKLIADSMGVTGILAMMQKERELLATIQAQQENLQAAAGHGLTVPILRLPLPVNPQPLATPKPRFNFGDKVREIDVAYEDGDYDTVIGIPSKGRIEIRCVDGSTDTLAEWAVEPYESEASDGTQS